MPTTDLRLRLLLILPTQYFFWSFSTIYCLYVIDQGRQAAFGYLLLLSMQNQLRDLQGKYFE